MVHKPHRTELDIASKTVEVLCVTLGKLAEADKLLFSINKIITNAKSSRTMIHIGQFSPWIIKYRGFNPTVEDLATRSNRCE